MRATVIYGAGDVRVETVPDPKILSRPMPWSGSRLLASAAATCGPTDPYPCPV